MTSGKIRDGAVTGEKLDDESITDEKIADKTISESKLNEEVISAIHSNKFDGEIELYSGMNWDILEFPIKTTQIYKLKMDAGNTGSGGILIVNCNYYEDSGIPLIVYGWSQTRIFNGYIYYRQTTSIVNNKPDAWSEWESRYLDKEVLETIDATIATHKDAKTLDHPDGSVTKPKLASDVIDWITGLVRGVTDFTGTLNPPSMMDSYIFPNDKGNLQIYRVEEDIGISGGGILLVTGITDYEFNTLTNITQTYITCFGEVKTRTAESWDVTTGEVAVWSDWKSVYTTVDDTATLSNRVETMAQEISENTLKINNILATDEAEYKTVESDTLILRSSIEGSTKKFALAVDDSGVISVSEIELSPEIEFE